jgi:hypothetical protein
MQSRSEFLRTILFTSLGATVLGACGSDGEPDPQPDASTGGVDAGPADAFMGTCATTSVSIGSNHGHEMTVEPADLDSTSSKVYEIRGSSDHPHRVTITPAQFATLKTEGTLFGRREIRVQRA